MTESGIDSIADGHNWDNVNNIILTSYTWAANKGEIRRYWRPGTPMFKKADLDRWIENGPMPAKRLSRIMSGH
jgi:hypothetical protein